MFIGVIGTRGFPDVQGGVERHCEELYTRLAAQGWDILVFTRASYLPEAPTWSRWKGIRFRKLWTPRHKSLEALWHSVAAVLLARARGIKLVHVHAIGPGLVVPLARLLGMRVVFTHHGRDYMRDKWGWAAKQMLRAGEYLAVRYAHRVLAVSREVEQWVAQRFGCSATYAPNGIALDPSSATHVDETLASLALRAQEYVVTVARLVPEKGLHDLLDAVATADIPGLVVVGDADHRSEYATALKARAPAKVRFLGMQPHEVTLDLVRAARVFALPSYHEGLPIALLEALACGTPVVASSIDPNREVITPGVHGWLVSPGDVKALRAALLEAWHLDASARQTLTAAGMQMVAERYSWEATTRLVIAAYRELIHK